MEEKEKPNKHWAQRYGGNFELAMEFLDESKEQQQAEKEETNRWIEDITIARSSYLALEATSRRRQVGSYSLDCCFLLNH